MQETIEHMSTQISEKWQALSKTRKIQLGVGVGVLLIALVLAIVLLSRPKTTQLYYQNLTAKQIAEVAEVLDNEKISYTIINNGQNLELS